MRPLRPEAFCVREGPTWRPTRPSCGSGWTMCWLVGPVGRPSAVGAPRMEQRGYRLSEVDAFDVCCGSDVWEAKHAE
jgi:hypothetical protein